MRRTDSPLASWISITSCSIFGQSASAMPCRMPSSLFSASILSRSMRSMPWLRMRSDTVVMRHSWLELRRRSAVSAAMSAFQPVNASASTLRTTASIARRSSPSSEWKPENTDDFS